MLSKNKSNDILSELNEIYQQKEPKTVDEAHWDELCQSLIIALGNDADEILGYLKTLEWSKLIHIDGIYEELIEKFPDTELEKFLNDLTVKVLQYFENLNSKY